MINKIFLRELMFLCLAVLMVTTSSCHRQRYADPDLWYSIGDESHAADVFYVYPTVLSREDANGNQRFNMMLYGEYNFYAPYYRQIAFESYAQPDSVLRQLAQTAANDVIDAFQYYMKHYNHGRPFFLMGHSQGSQMLIELLKHSMTKDQRDLMVAAYCIGYHVTAEELAEYPEALQPATDSTQTGKLVVFNSVTDTTAIGMISRYDVVGVNPATWTMAPDTVAPAYHLGMAKYSANRDSVLIVPCNTRTYLYKHTTVCPDLDPEMVYYPAYEQMFPRGNLHFADSWLFGGNVVENMRCRLRHFRGTD